MAAREDHVRLCRYIPCPLLSALLYFSCVVVQILRLNTEQFDSLLLFATFENHWLRCSRLIPPRLLHRISFAIKLTPASTEGILTLTSLTRYHVREKPLLYSSYSLFQHFTLKPL